jgi:hypothetical protein
MLQGVVSSSWKQSDVVCRQQFPPTNSCVFIRRNEIHRHPLQITSIIAQGKSRNKLKHTHWRALFAHQF